MLCAQPASGYDLTSLCVHTTGAWDMATFFDEEATVRVTTFTTPAMFVNRLKSDYGEKALEGAGNALEKS